MPTFWDVEITSGSPVIQAQSGGSDDIARQLLVLLVLVGSRHL